MEKVTDSDNRFAQLKETDRLSNFLNGVLDKYGSAIARDDEYGQLGVYKGDLLIQANEFLNEISKNNHNIRREGILRKLMYDLLPAKELFDDNGNLINNIVKNGESISDGPLSEVLNGLPNALLVGKPILDAFNVIGTVATNSKDTKRVDNDLLVEVVKKDKGKISSNGDRYDPRNKLERMSLVFNKSSLVFLLNQVKDENDFDSFILRIKSGDIPFCFISTEETRRTRAFWDYKEKNLASKWVPSDPVPPIPAFGRMVTRFKGGEKLNDILDTLANEKPYSEDRDGNKTRKEYTMIPVISSDPTDLP